MVILILLVCASLHQWASAQHLFTSPSKSFTLNTVQENVEVKNRLPRAWNSNEDNKWEWRDSSGDGPINQEAEFSYSPQISFKSPSSVYPLLETRSLNEEEEEEEESIAPTADSLDWLSRKSLSYPGPSLTLFDVASKLSTVSIDDDRISTTSLVPIVSTRIVFLSTSYLDLNVPLISSALTLVNNTPVLESSPMFMSSSSLSSLSSSSIAKWSSQLSQSSIAKDDLLSSDIERTSVEFQSSTYSSNILDSSYSLNLVTEISSTTVSDEQSSSHFNVILSSVVIGLVSTVLIVESKPIDEENIEQSSDINPSSVYFNSESIWSESSYSTDSFSKTDITEIEIQSSFVSSRTTDQITTTPRFLTTSLHADFAITESPVSYSSLEYSTTLIDQILSRESNRQLDQTRALTLEDNRSFSIDNIDSIETTNVLTQSYSRQYVPHLPDYTPSLSSSLPTIISRQKSFEDDVTTYLDSKTCDTPLGCQTNIVNSQDIFPDKTQTVIPTLPYTPDNDSTSIIHRNLSSRSTNDILTTEQPITTVDEENTATITEEVSTRSEEVSTRSEDASTVTEGISTIPEDSTTITNGETTTKDGISIVTEPETSTTITETLFTLESTTISMSDANSTVYPVTTPTSIETSETSYLRNENFWIRTVIKAEPRKWETYMWEEIPPRLARAYLHAYHRKMRKLEPFEHREKRSPIDDEQVDMIISITLIAWSVNLSEKNMDLIYTMSKDDIPVESIEATNLLALLSQDEVKNEIGYPVVIKAEPFQRNVSLASSIGRHWVILVAVGVTGISVALLICGALAYYRCCRKPDELLVMERDSEPTSPSYGRQNVQRLLQEGVVTLDIRSGGDSKGVDDADLKRPLPEVPGTSQKGFDNESNAKRSSKRLKTFLEKPKGSIASTQTEGIVNQAFEDDNQNVAKNDQINYHKTSRQPIKDIKGRDKNEISPTSSNGYFDHVPIPVKPSEASTLPSNASLLQKAQNTQKERHKKKHSNKIGASPPICESPESKSQLEINKLIDETLAATTQRSKVGSAVCETIESKNESAPRVVWTVYKADSNGIAMATSSEDFQLKETENAKEPFFIHSDKHPTKLDYTVRSGEPSMRPLTAPDLKQGSKQKNTCNKSDRPSSHQSSNMQKNEGLVEAINDELDMVSALRAKEPAESVIKAIKQELKKFNSALPGTSAESSA